MALEVTQFISGLVESNPSGTDDTSQGDDHLRLIKSTIKATFPNITGAVTATQAQINTLPTVATELPTFLKTDGSRAMTAPLNMGNNRLIAVGDATAGTDAVTLNQLNAVLASLSASALTLAQVREAIYPVGFRIMLGVDTNPATLLGVGSWSRVSQGRYVAGSGTGPVGTLQTVGTKQTGGSTQIALGLANMPNHTHVVAAEANVTGPTEPSSTNRIATTRSDGSSSFNYGLRGSGSAATVGQTSAAGSGAPFTHIQPFEAVAIWERVS